MGFEGHELPVSLPGPAIIFSLQLPHFSLFGLTVHWTHEFDKKGLRRLLAASSCYKTGNSDPLPMWMLREYKFLLFLKRRHNSKSLPQITCCTDSRPAVVSNCCHVLDYLEDLFPHKLLGTSPRVSVFIGWAMARQSALPTGPEVILMLLVPNPQAETSCSIAQWVTLEPRGKELEY